MGQRNIAARSRTGTAGATVAALVLTASASAHAQALPPTPADARLAQDRLDLRGRSSLDLGSGARAYGMGGAFLARADDATAASWNPAGLSYLRRPELSLVGARNSFTSEEVRPETGFLETEHGVGRVADFVAATYPISIGAVSGAAQVSYQRAISFTSDRVAENADILRTVEGDGGFDVIALGTGLRVSNSLRVGGTINRWVNGYVQTVIREPLVGRTRGRVDQESEFDLAGWNANLGVIWEPHPSLNLGLVGKTPFTADVSLRRARTDLHPSGTAFTRNAYASDDVRLDLPGAVGVGASWRPLGQLTVSADYTRTFWSKARVRNFFTLAPTVDGEPPPTPQESGDFYESLPFPTMTTPANDTQQVRFGVEYVLIGDQIRLPIRAGYFSDWLTNPDSAGGSPRFNGATVGMGVGVGPLLLDVAFVYEKGDYVDPQLFEQSLTARRILVSLIYRDLVRR